MDITVADAAAKAEAFCNLRADIHKRCTGSSLPPIELITEDIDWDDETPSPHVGVYAESGSPLFALPAEIRNLIYAFALKEPKVRFLDTLVPPPLARVCRQIRKECLPVFLLENRVNTLFVKKAVAHDVELSPVTLAWLRELGLHNPLLKSPSFELQGRTHPWSKSFSVATTRRRAYVIHVPGTCPACSTISKTDDNISTLAPLLHDVLPKDICEGLPVIKASISELLCSLRTIHTGVIALLTLATNFLNKRDQDALSVYDLHRLAQGVTVEYDEILGSVETTHRFLDLYRLWALPRITSLREELAELVLQQQSQAEGADGTDSQQQHGHAVQESTAP